MADSEYLNKRIFLSPPHMSGNEQKFINEAFETNWIAPLGPNVDAFEKEIAEYAGVKSAAALSSGTAAIHLALQLLDVKGGDIVFCSTLTFIASASPIIYQGACPVFIDSEPDTWNMSPKALKRAFIAAEQAGRLPKAVIVVNLYGQSAKMDEILMLCHQYGVPIIEDAAESLGSSYKGKKSGTFGKFGIYSFNGNKIITTSGGGMLISDDEAAIEKARYLASQARDKALHYQHSQIGYNYRLSNILSGIGRAQLKVLKERVASRRIVFERYKDSLGAIPGIDFMPEWQSSFSNRWLTALTIDPEKLKVSPKKIIQELDNNNIEARPVWKPLHLQPVFRGVPYYAHQPGYSFSEDIFKKGLCLPSGSNMSEEKQNSVIKVIQNVLESPLIHTF